MCIYTTFSTFIHRLVNTKPDHIMRSLQIVQQNSPAQQGHYHMLIFGYSRYIHRFNMASSYKTSTFNVLRNLLVFPCHSGLNHHIFVRFRFWDSEVQNTSFQVKVQVLLLEVLGDNLFLGLCQIPKVGALLGHSPVHL